MSTERRMVSRIVINGSIDAVWRELTKQDEPQLAVFNTWLHAQTLAPGASMQMRTSSGKKVMVVGQVLDYDPPHRFSHSFRFAGYDDPPCVVAYDLRQVTGGVEVTLTVAVGNAAHVCSLRAARVHIAEQMRRGELADVGGELRSARAVLCSDASVCASLFNAFGCRSCAHAGLCSVLRLIPPVLANDLAFAAFAIRFAADEIDAGRGVCRLKAVTKESVELREPEDQPRQSEPYERLPDAGVRNGLRCMPKRLRRSTKGADRKSSAFFFECATSKPQSAETESREVIRAHVDGLHERNVGEEHAARLQHTMDFIDASLRAHDVFKDGLTDHEIERIGLERQVMPVSNEIAARTEVNVGLDDRVARFVQQLFQPRSGLAAADNENTGTRNSGQHAANAIADVSGDEIYADARYEAS
jgi:uncharacterized protein YndB with AHSA1/START domain/plasmid stability protein